MYIGTQVQQRIFTQDIENYGAAVQFFTLHQVTHKRRVVGSSPWQTQNSKSVVVWCAEYYKGPAYSSLVRILNTEYNRIATQEYTQIILSGQCPQYSPNHAHTHSQSEDMCTCVFFVLNQNEEIYDRKFRRSDQKIV